MIKRFTFPSQFQTLADFETRFGSTNVKWTPVYFYVQRNREFSRENSIITFNEERLNLGGAMNINTGVFTAQRSGTYFFSFAYMKDNQSKSILIFIRKNRENVGAAHVERLTNTMFQSSLFVTLKLKLGDTVDLFQIRNGNMFDDASHYTHFTGWLMEEDLEIPN